MMTSLYPLSHGVQDFSDRLPAAAETLAEQYRAAGFATVGYSSVLFTGQFTNLHQGFEEFHEGGSVDDGPSSKTAREYVSRLADWLESHREVPFSAYLHIFDPHDPFEPREPYATRWADAATSATRISKMLNAYSRSSTIRCFVSSDSLTGVRSIELVSIPRLSTRTSRTGTTGPFAVWTPSWGGLMERLQELGPRGRHDGRLHQRPR